jgi:hypothetical protein
MSQDTRSAAEAFDALREEVGKLRNGIEQIYRQGQEIKTVSKPADYNSTLGSMAKRLGAIEDHLRHIESAMPMRVAKLPGEQLSSDEMVKINKEVKAAVLELREAAGHAIKKQALRWWLAGMFGFGITIGIALCIGTAAIFPQAAGAWAAGAIVGGDPWDAGQTLMRQADPTSYDRMVQLYQACPMRASVDLCRAAIAAKTATVPGQ